MQSVLGLLFCLGDIRCLWSRLPYHASRWRTFPANLLHRHGNFLQRKRRQTDIGPLVRESLGNLSPFFRPSSWPSSTRCTRWALTPIRNSAALRHTTTGLLVNMPCMGTLCAPALFLAHCILAYLAGPGMCPNIIIDCHKL